MSAVTSGGVRALGGENLLAAISGRACKKIRSMDEDRDERSRLYEEGWTLRRFLRELVPPFRCRRTTLTRFGRACIDQAK